MIESLIRATPGWAAYFASDGEWKYPPHLALLDRLLVKICRREIDRLVVNMPPRHGKSELISKYLPFWTLGSAPSTRIILTSYGAKLSETFGLKARELIKTDGAYLFNRKINAAERSVARFGLQDESGGMDCLGAGGAITGKGADLLLIDDPIKNDAQANSPVIREKLWEWFLSTALTRLEPGGAVIVIATRWNEDDLCGRIEKNFDCVYLDNFRSLDFTLESDEWLITKLPVIAASDDISGRKEGETLWKERFSVSDILKRKEALGSYWFSALYQQSPAPLDGGIFKRSFFKYFEEDEEFYYLVTDDSKRTAAKSDCPIYAVLDLAVTTKETSDYTVALIFALTPRRDALVLEVIRERFEGADHVKALENIYNRWNPSLIGIESSQYQLSLVQSALRLGLPAKELKPDKDKVSRALPMQARLEAGKVYFKRRAHWLDAFENELLNFPRGERDDQVDAFAYISYLIPEARGVEPVGNQIKRNNKRKVTTGF